MNKKPWRERLEPIVGVVIVAAAGFAAYGLVDRAQCYSDFNRRVVMALEERTDARRVEIDAHQNFVDTVISTDDERAERQAARRWADALENVERTYRDARLPDYRCSVVSPD